MGQPYLGCPQRVVEGPLCLPPLLQQPAVGKGGLCMVECYLTLLANRGSIVDEVADGALQPAGDDGQGHQDPAPR